MGSHLKNGKSQKQATVARSSAEAEYIAMSYTAVDKSAMKGWAFLAQRRPSSMFCDNIKVP